MARKIEDAFQLAAHLVEADLVEEGQADYFEVGDKLHIKYNISMEEFEALANDLLRHTPVMATPRSGKSIHTFGHHVDCGKEWVTLLRTEAEISVPDGA